MAVHNPTQIFFCQLHFKNDSFIMERNLVMQKKYKLFITIFTTMYWVKPAWPAEPLCQLRHC